MKRPHLFVPDNDFYFDHPGRAFLWELLVGSAFWILFLLVIGAI